jgi:hypothetical protein
MPVYHLALFDGGAMRSRALLTVVAASISITPGRAAAEKMPAAFKAAFEQTFRPKWTFAVVVREGIPTTSIYGVEGKQTAAHFSVDVVGGQWKESQGLLDTDQSAVDFLGRGEVMQLTSISYKDNRVDLRLESVEAHRVTRGSWPLKSTKREPVATNFKFFLPFTVSGAEDVPRAVEYIGQYLRPFSSEQQARAFAARVVGGHDVASAREERAPSSTAPASASTKKEIKAGMTPLEVLDILGKPQKELSFENRSRWTYPDLVIVFENGRVKEVKF